MEILKGILYSDLGSSFNNIVFLIFRTLLAIQLFRVHGLQKFRLMESHKEIIPNPLGLPYKLNALIAAFSELVVPVLIILGLGTRLAVLPTIAMTAIGYFVIHRKDSLEVRDIPYMYTISLLLILALGAGKYSLDYYLLNLL